MPLGKLDVNDAIPQLSVAVGSAQVTGTEQFVPFPVSVISEGKLLITGIFVSAVFIVWIQLAEAVASLATHVLVMNEPHPEVLFTTSVNITLTAPHELGSAFVPVATPVTLGSVEPPQLAKFPGQVIVGPAQQEPDTVTLKEHTD